ncbi:MAG: hypothetical protein ACOC2W_00240 [bacterium]
MKIHTEEDDPSKETIKCNIELSDDEKEILEKIAKKESISIKELLTKLLIDYQKNNMSK